MRRAFCAIALACALVTACSGAEPQDGSGANPSPAVSEAASPTPRSTAAADAAAEPSPAVSAGDEPAIEPSGGFATTTLTLRPPEGAVGDVVQVEVWVADSPALRARGLMGREELAPGTGMVFEFDSDSTARFWMRDTLLPLSIAFVDGDGTIIDIVDMDPCTTSDCPRYGPDEPYRRALEVPQGWFDEVGVAPGWLLE